MDATRYHSLLADVHRLLGGYTRKEFSEAAQQSNDCRTLLQSLADALSKDGQTKTSQLNATEDISAGSLPTEGRPTSSDAKSPEEIENVLRRSGKAETTNDMMAICQAFDIHPSLSSKDSRARNLTKLAKAIAYSPAKIRNHVLKELTRKTTSETQGWLDVIRSRR